MTFTARIATTSPLLKVQSMTQPNAFCRLLIAWSMEIYAWPIDRQRAETARLYAIANGWTEVHIAEVQATLDDPSYEGSYVVVGMRPE